MSTPFPEELAMFAASGKQLDDLLDIVRSYGAAEYKRGTEELESHGRVLRKTMEALQAVTAERDEYIRISNVLRNEAAKFEKELKVRDDCTSFFNNRARALAKECIALQVKNDALKADAERYQWLRHEHEVINPLAAVVWKKNGVRNSSDWANTSGPVELDREIDAALEGKS